jgi:hypothetical protein
LPFIWNPFSIGQPQLAVWKNELAPALLLVELRGERVPK